ncbi:MAG TPA: M20/M25/M40 family metallo-hydrolase, partial [Parachlamydiaceae bacterium]|nr:M20/M25/M40 family metallo-hydrolase [Parachlamydiaceae bacterium]
VTQHTLQQELLSSADPGSLLSMNITSFEAGSYQDGSVALNVISESATATVDIRIPPALKIEDVKRLLHTKLQAFPSVTLHVEAVGEEREPKTGYETTLYKTLSECITEQGIEPRPLIFEAASDLRFYHQCGIEGVGFSPFTSKDLLHSINEAISIADLIRGKEILFRLLQRMCMHRGQ